MIDLHKAPLTLDPNAALRPRLLEAVRRIVENEGPGAVTVASAARMTGVTSGAPYRHFKDRPALLRGAANAGMSRLFEVLEDAAKRAGTAQERLVAVGLAYLGFASREPGIFRLIFGLDAANSDMNQDNLEGPMIVVALVSQALAVSADSITTRRRAVMIWSAVHGRAFLNLARPDKLADAWVSDRAFLDATIRAYLLVELSDDGI